MNDVNRLRILQDVIDRRLTTRLAATRLEISDRHCRRLLERYREHGPLSLVNRRRGQPGNRQLIPGLAERALRIIRERYADFGPTLACEKLAEVHGLYLAKETVRKLMTQAGLWIPRKLRAPRVHQPRPRRACTGELIQIDGCEHRWFEDRGPACTLLVYVDDATSRLMQLLFVSSESTFTYFEATRGYLERYGKPLAFYSDKASVFRINNKQATGGDGQTQFGRAMNELNITGICANTSSAKGRVERAHLTLQTAWSRSCGSAVSVHPRQQTPLPENSWLTTTAGLRSHLVTISTFTVRLRIMKIWRQHSPGVNIVRSQKT